MPDPYIGEIRAFPYTYAPEGWLLCGGQEEPIMEYQALFAVIRTFYGGDGRNTFRTPNLNGTVAMGAGTGPGLDPVQLGQQLGENTKSLDERQLPSHRHVARAELELAENASPANGYLGVLQDPQRTGVMVYKQGAATLGTTTAMSHAALQSAGDGQLYDNRQPYVAFRYCINYDGIYPMRPS